MKRTLVILVATFAMACNNASDKSAAGSKDTTAQQGTTANADAGVPPGLTKDEYDKAINLIAKSDCLTCHKVDEKVTGPAYREVAQRYEATPENINKLAEKVIKGGSGTWGAIPMTPHDSLSTDDAKAMIKYILALKNTK